MMPEKLPLGDLGDLGGDLGDPGDSGLAGIAGAAAVWGFSGLTPLRFPLLPGLLLRLLLLLLSLLLLSLGLLLSKRNSLLPLVVLLALSLSLNLSIVSIESLRRLGEGGSKFGELVGVLLVALRGLVGAAIGAAVVLETELALLVLV
jgi:hypothetical protein